MPTRKMTTPALRLGSGLVLLAVSHAAGAAETDWPLPVHDDTRYGQVLFDRFEYQAGDDEDVLAWELQAWYGGDIDRLWVEAEGEDIVSGGDGGELEQLDVLYGHRFDRFWDVRAGVGYQTTYGPGPDRDRASVLVGLQGLAPYWFEVDTHLRLSEDGDVAADLEAEYDWRLTQQWILQGRAETAYAFHEIEQFGVGEGVTGLTLGLRLRYHFTRDIAPYIGVTWRDRFGDTADLIEAAGEESDSTAVVAGVRWWF